MKKIYHIHILKVSCPEHVVMFKAQLYGIRGSRKIMAASELIKNITFYFCLPLPLITVSLYQDDLPPVLKIV